MKTIELGVFEVVSGILIISDPCYERGIWCQGKLEGVPRGKWFASVEVEEGEGGRVMALMAARAGYRSVGWIRMGWRKEPFEVGVDSGQAGLFDVAHYRDDAAVVGVDRISADIICPEEPWYSIACDRTLSEIGAGIIPFGCVSSSGYGDGSYECHTFRDREDAIAVIRVTFITDEE